MCSKKELNSNANNSFDIIGSKLIGLVYYLITLLFIFILLISIIYFLDYFLPEKNQGFNTVTSQIISLWEKTSPIIINILSIILPLLGLIVTLWFLTIFSKGKNISDIISTDSIPSILAIIVISVVCILPLIGKEIPREIGSIALVVIGFYFGKNSKDKK
ncbi:hypothetical protein V6478_003837 [Providencia rettgeri]|uniref:hypothetical protein n=1 Tax=Providencia sp. PROV148 TaxID=2949858 RepID=UPI00234ADE0B|nr:hypothetical protein [Providencia sp. PROV148]EJD6475155.1 hypothetical protein [Providencia rettgeri]ELR5066458.1 hypothetical protein [Providencia rettgeri]ELR5163762.1 hypothetical protein [Providencia rettgeri]